MSYDGEIIINTEMDTTQFDAGSDRLKEAVKGLIGSMNRFDGAVRGTVSAAYKEFTQLNSAYAKTKDEIESVRLKMQELSTQQLPSDEFKATSTDIEKARTELNKLMERQIKYESLGVKNNSRQWKSLQYDIDLTKRKLNDAISYQNTLLSRNEAYVPGTGTQQYADLDARLQQLSGRLPGLSASIQGSVDSIQRAVAEYDNELNRANAEQSRFSKIGSAVANGFRKIGGAAKGAVSGLKNFVTHSKKSKSASNGLAKSIKRLGNMFKLLLIRMAMRAVITAAREGFQNLSRYSEQTNRDMSALMSSLTRLKNSFATAFAPILTIVTPALTSLINKVSEALTVIGKFMAAITGKSTFTQAKAVQEDYAKSLNGTASAAKKAANSLYSFDELNVVKQDDSSGGTPGKADPSQMFEEVPIESQIASFAERIKAAFQAGDFFGIGSIIGDSLNNALEGIDWGSIQERAAGIAGNIASLLNGFIAGTDWNLIGSTLGNGINTALRFLYTFIITFDWSLVGKALGDGINGLGNSIDWSLVGKTISDGIHGLFTLLINAVKETDWQQAGRNIGEALCSIDWGQLLSDVWDLFLSAVLGLVEFFFGIGESIGQWLMEGLEGGISFSDIIHNAWNWIKEHIFNPIVNTFKKLFGINSPSTVFRDLGKFLIQGLQNGIKNLWNLIPDFFKEKIAALKDNVKEGFTKMKDSAVSVFRNMKTSISNVFSGLLNNIRGIVNKIIGAIEGMVNHVIDGINWLTSKLNVLHIDLPNGEVIGFDIPALPNLTLPRLATGTVVPPRAGEFAAILGDNKREPEIVSPISSMQDALRSVLEETGTEINIIAKGNNAEFVRWISFELEKESGRKGSNFKVVTG